MVGKMTSARSAAIAAILFAIVFVGSSMVLMGQVESGSMSAADFADKYDKAGGRATTIGAGYVALLGTALLGLFTVHLLGRLRTAEGGDAPLSRLAQLAAVMLATTWVVGTMAQVNVAGAIQFGDYDVPSPETAVFFSQFGTGIVLLGSMIAASALMALTAAVAFRSAAFPRWVAWLSAAAAVIVLFGPLFFPAIAFPIWLVALGIHLLRSGEAPSLAGSPSAVPA
jgi:hypothetical protein